MTEDPLGEPCCRRSEGSRSEGSRWEGRRWEGRRWEGRRWEGRRWEGIDALQANIGSVAEPTTVVAGLREELEDLVAVLCKALNDPKRLMILYALAEGPLTVSDISEVLEAPQSNTSQHLALLRDRGLLDAERRGSNVWYSLRHPKLLAALDLLREVRDEELARQRAIRLSAS